MFDEYYECPCHDCNDPGYQGDCECGAIHDENEIGGYCACCGGAVQDDDSEEENP